MMKTRQRFNRYIFILACFIASAWCQSSAGAETYYVAKTGNDSNSCTMAQNQTTPKKTITIGLKCIASGDTLIVKGGTYAETLVNASPPSGTASAYTTIKAADGETVWLRPTSFATAQTSTNLRIVELARGRHHIKVERINIDGSGLPNDGVHGATLLSTGDQTHHLIFDDMEMKHSRGDAIHFRPSSYGNILRNSYTHDVGPSVGSNTSPAGGMYLRGPKLAEVPIPNATLANTPGNLIENNRFENIPCCGITQRGLEVNNTIRGNVFKNIDGPPMGIGAESQNTQFYNNIVMNNRACIELRPGSTGRVYNNTFYNSGNGPWGCFPNRGRADLDSVPAQWVRNNIFYKVTVNGSIPASNFIGDPKFVNPDQGNFKLQEGSPAIDAGIALSEVPDDIEGSKRPAGGSYDMGAYEFHSGVSQPFSVLQPPNLGVLKFN